MTTRRECGACIPSALSSCLIGLHCYVLLNHCHYCARPMTMPFHLLHPLLLFIAHGCLCTRYSQPIASSSSLYSGIFTLPSFNCHYSRITACTYSSTLVSGRCLNWSPHMLFLLYYHCIWLLHSHHTSFWTVSERICYTILCNCYCKESHIKSYFGDVAWRPLS